MPAVNVQDCLRSRIWRTVGLTGQSLLANMGMPTDPEDVRPPVQALVLINHNLTRAAEVTVQAALTSDFAAPLLTETQGAWADIIGAGEGGAGGPPGAGGVIFDCHRAWYAPNPIRIIYLENSTREAKGYWKISFSDPNNPDGYIQIGRIFLTYFDEYKYDWAWPWGLGGEDESQVEYNPSGVPWTDRWAFHRTLRFGWNERFSDEDKYWRFYFMLMKMGISQDWVIDPIPEGVSSRHFTALYGRLKEIPELDQWINGYSDLEINFKESL